ECLVLHADHGMNASTFAARVCAATLSDLHSAVTAAVGTLKGPLHGGGTEAVLALLEQVGSVQDAPAAMGALFDRGERLVGFGHRTYRGEDPRTRHLRALSRRLAELSGEPGLHRLSEAVEQAVAGLASADGGLRPNADFYAAGLYHGLGIPADLF